MRFFGVALAASALVLGACGGGDKAATDTTAAASSAAPAPATDSAAAAAPAAGAPAAGAVAPAPITGKTHEVKMVGDEKGYRFEPADITVKQGDGIKFVMVSGGPHNVAFEETGIPAAASAQLSANIENAAAPLTSQMTVNPNEVVNISFANVPAGTYNFHCTPHLAMGMKGVITVQ